MLLLKNCTFISELTENNLTAGHILVENGRIKQVLPSEEPLPPCAPEDIVDMSGRSVLPGLFDLHIHLSLSGGDTLIDNAKPPVRQAFHAVKFAQDSLMSGFTTLRDVGSYYNVAIELRDAIKEGFLIGPNIIAAGRIVTATECGNDFFSGLYSEADGSQEIWKAVRNEMKQGADFIKIMGTGAVMNPGGAPGQPIYSLGELKAVVDAARFKDTYVATHCHGTETIKNSIRAGVRTLEHASILDDEAIEMLMDSKETFIVPTLSIIMGLADSVPDSSVFMKAKAQMVMDHLRTGMRKAYEAGLVLGFGTDQGATPLYHGQNADEFALRRDFWGMKEIDIIKQATINSALLAGVSHEYGTITAGKAADIIALDKDPLKDITAFRTNVCTVIKSGAIVKNSSNQ